MNEWMDERSFELQNIKKKCNIYMAKTTSLVYSLIIMVVLMYVQKIFSVYSFLQKVQLNSLPLKCELDRHCDSLLHNRVWKRKTNSNFAGEKCGMHHLSHMIQVYITSTKSWWHNASQTWCDGKVTEKGWRRVRGHDN